MRYALPLIGALLLGVSTAAQVQADGSPKAKAAASPRTPEDDEAKRLVRVFTLR